MKIRHTLLVSSLCSLTYAQAGEIPFADGELAVLAESITQVGFAKPKTDGGLKTEFSWHGVRVSKMADGKCVETTRTDFKLVPDAQGQRPTFVERKAEVACPGKQS